MSNDRQKERPTSNVQRPIMNKRHCRGLEKILLLLCFLGRCHRLSYYGLSALSWLHGDKPLWGPFAISNKSNEEQNEYPIPNTQQPISNDGQKERPTLNVQRPIMNERHCRGQVRALLVLLFTGFTPRAIFCRAFNPFRSRKAGTSEPERLGYKVKL
jgi:hypothetical protein